MPVEAEGILDGRLLRVSASASSFVCGEALHAPLEGLERGDDGAGAERVRSAYVEPAARG